MSRIPPQVHAMLVCDQAFQQAGTGKWCVIGTHNLVQTTQVPVPHALAVFLSLGDFESGTRFQLVLRHEDGDVLCKAEAEAGTGQQVGTLDVGLQLPIVPLPHEGMYRFELSAMGKVLATRRVFVQVGDASLPEPRAGDLEVRALLICDLAFQQHQTNEWHIIGVYEVVTVQSLPTQHAPFVVFWSLGGFAGDGVVMVTVRDNEGEVVGAVRAMLPKLPGGSFECAFPFPPLELKKAGSHSVELHVADHLLAVRSFHVRVAPPSAPPIELLPPPPPPLA